MNTNIRSFPFPLFFLAALQLAACSAEARSDEEVQLGSETPDEPVCAEGTEDCGEGEKANPASIIANMKSKKDERGALKANTFTIGNMR